MSWLVCLKYGKWEVEGPKMYLNSPRFAPSNVVGYTEEEFAKLPKGQEVTIVVNEPDLSDVGRTHFAHMITYGALSITAIKVNGK